MLYVGLDVHSKQSSLCILNSAGGTVNEIQVKGPRSGVVDRVAGGVSRISEVPWDGSYLRVLFLWV